ncbi:MAG: hypothetical protein QG597_3526 [Actinomycetota bacterium]|nr:hypothetical protein [Actinomycetota bacterium]
MRTRTGVGNSCSALRVVERVFAVTTAEPAGLVLRRTDLDPDPGEGLPDGPIPLPALRGLVLSPSVPQATRDAVWRVLILRSRTDGSSWLVATVGMALPGLRRQVGVLAGPCARAREDLESAVLEGFVAALHTVDVTCRGLCGRLVRAGYRAGMRQVLQDAPFAGAAPCGFASHAPHAPWGHPDFVLAAAITAGVLSRQEAWLIGVTRLEDVPVAHVAAELGEATNTVVVRRRRAEHRLRDALAEGVLAGVSRPACHPRLTGPPLQGGDPVPIRDGSPIARGVGTSPGHGHVSGLPHPGKEDGSPPAPRAITTGVGAALSAAWSGGDLT